MSSLFSSGKLGFNVLFALVMSQLLVVVGLGLLVLGVSLLGALVGGAGANGGVGFLVHGFDLISVDASGDEAGELLLVSFFVLFLQRAHVISNMTAQNVFTEGSSVELVALSIITRESLGLVRDLQATVDGTLQDGKDTSTSGGTGQTNIEQDIEWSRTVGVVFNEVELTVGILDTNILVGQVELSEHSSGNQQTSGVSSSVVSKTERDSVTRKLVRVSSRENNVVINSGVDDLSNNVAVGNANNKSVFVSVVFVLVLSDQSLTGIVVGLTLSSSDSSSLLSSAS
jgi:hypothetical protein